MKAGALASYIPLLLVVALTPAFFGVLDPGFIEPPNYSVFPEEGVGPVLNALMWVAATAAFGLLILLLTRRFRDLLRVMMMTVAIYTIFSVSYLYTGGFLALLGRVEAILPILLSAALAGLALISLLGERSIALYSLLLLASMTGIGTLFDFSFGDLTKIVILVAYALFDLYSVYKGVLRKVFADRERAIMIFSPLLVRLGPLTVGVGDIIFYAMMLSFALQSSPTLFWVASAALVLSHALNLILLSRQRMIPALPIPVLVTLTTILVLKPI